MKIFGSLVVSLLPPANVYTRDKFRISAKSCISQTPFPFSSKQISLQNSSHWKTKPLNNICHPTTPFAAPKNKSVQNVSPYINRSIFLLSFISSPKQPFCNESHIFLLKNKSLKGGSNFGFELFSNVNYAPQSLLHRWASPNIHSVMKFLESWKTWPIFSPNLLETLAAPYPKPLSKKINFRNVSIILMTVFWPSTLKMKQWIQMSTQWLTEWIQVLVPYMFSWHENIWMGKL
jgi:hypothetical protein